MRILIVEDEKISSKKMQVIMANFGECDEIASGVKALEAFKKALEMRIPYDLITLDINLEEMNGLDVLIKLREIEEECNIPLGRRTKVIMVTSHNDRDHVTACLTANCNGYIVKPFTKESIQKCLKDIYLQYINKVLTV